MLWTLPSMVYCRMVFIGWALFVCVCVCVFARYRTYIITIEFIMDIVYPLSGISDLMSMSDRAVPLDE